MTRAIRHKNWHSVAETYNDVTFIVKLLVAKNSFKKILGHSSGDNGKSTNTNLFWKKTAALAKSILLQNYISWAQENCIQARTQAAEGNRKIKQDLLNKNLNNFIKYMSV